MLELIDGRETLGPVHLSRPLTGTAERAVEGAVAEIVADVRLRGDTALAEATQRFDEADVPPSHLRVSAQEIAAAVERIPAELADALDSLARRLTTTSEKGLPTSWIERTESGFFGEQVVPLRRAGLYVPGGRAAYPSSVLMTSIPARVAGVEGIAVATPPSADGSIPDAVLAACSIAGVDEVYRMGGAQAIAAFAYGTETVRPVDKIVGPGNIYVTLAKRMVQASVGIDSEAGPTELMIVAGPGASPERMAADLMAQAEHGPHGAHVLVTWDREIASLTMNSLDLQVHTHPRSAEVEQALTQGGNALLVRDLEQAIGTANAFGPEHLQLEFDDAESVLPRIWNAGSVFVGPYTPVAVGDYAGSTNHVLPSGGAARFSSGLSARDFIKTIYVSGTTLQGLEEIAPDIVALATAEGLPFHAATVLARTDDLD